MVLELSEAGGAVWGSGLGVREFGCWSLGCFTASAFVVEGLASLSPNPREVVGKKPKKIHEPPQHPYEQNT